MAFCKSDVAVMCTCTCPSIYNGQSHSMIQTVRLSRAVQAAIVVDCGVQWHRIARRMPGGTDVLLSAHASVH
jgi:hypothetical protein